MYVSRRLELHLFPREIAMVYWGVGCFRIFKVCLCLKQIFLKVANGLSILSKKKKKKNECDTVALMITGKLI